MIFPIFYRIVEGTKDVLVEYINSHFDENPQLSKVGKYNKYFIYREKYSTPTKKHVKMSSSDDEQEEEEVPEQEMEEEEVIIQEEENEAFDDDEIEEVASDFEDENIEAFALEQENEALKKELELEENDDIEIEIELKELEEEAKIGLCSEFVKKFEAWKEESEYLQRLCDTNEQVKDFLSGPCKVWYFQMLLEFFYVISPYISFYYYPLRLKFVNTISFLQKYEIVNVPILDIGYLLGLDHLRVISFWLFITVVLPIIGAYYFNYKKTSSIDFFVLYLAKYLICYICLVEHINFAAFLEDSITKGGEVIDRLSSSENASIISAYQYVRSYLFHSCLSLRVSLGSVPLAGAMIGLAVTIYLAIIGY